jgi:hypothetical protein
VAGLAAQRRALARLLAELEGSVKGLHLQQAAARTLQAGARGKQARTLRTTRQASVAAERHAAAEATAAVTLQAAARRRFAVAAVGSARSARDRATRGEQQEQQAAVVLQAALAMSQRLDGLHSRVAEAVVLQSGWRRWLAAQRRRRRLQHRAAAATADELAAEAEDRAPGLARERAARRAAEQQRAARSETEDAQCLAAAAEAAAAVSDGCARAAAASQLQSQARRQQAQGVSAPARNEAVPLADTAAATTLQAWARQQAALRVAAVAKTRATVRAYFNGELPLPRRPLGNASHLGFLLGATVEARYKGRHGWFPAAIAAVRNAGGAFATFELRYADGDVEAGVPRRRVRLHGQGEPFHLSHGSACEARFGNSKQLYPAMVVNAWPDGEHYMVEFDDGDRDSRVPRDHIFVACIFPLRTHARAATSLQVRSRVGSAVWGVSLTFLKRVGGVVVEGLTRLCCP